MQSAPALYVPGPLARQIHLPHANPSSYHSFRLTPTFYSYLYSYLTNSLVLLSAFTVFLKILDCQKLPLQNPILHHKRDTAMRLASLILSLVAVSCAAPFNFFDDAYEFSDDLSEYYGRVSHYIHKLGHSSSPLECNTSQIKLPSWASKLNITSLSNPEGLKPLSVALGRGTQVYKQPSTFGILLSLTLYIELHLCGFYV